MQARCFSCGAVIGPLARYLDSDNRLRKEFVPFEQSDEELLANPNKRTLDRYHARHCCRMRLLSWINPRDQYQVYHAGSTLQHTVFKERGVAAPTGTAETLQLTTAGGPHIVYEPPRKYVVRNLSPEVGIFLRQLFMDELWCVGFAATDAECAAAPNTRFIDNNDTLRNTLRQVPLIAPLDESAIRTPADWRAACTAFAEQYVGCLRDAHEHTTQIHIVTTHALTLKRVDTGSIDTAATARAIPQCLVDPTVARPIDITALKPKLRDRGNARETVPTIDFPSIRIVPVKPLWNKAYTMFSQVHFLMQPDEARIQARIEAIRAAHADQPEALARALERFERDERALLRSEDTCEFWLSMVAPYCTYGFAWRMVFATAAARLTRFRDCALPTKAIAQNAATYDHCFELRISDDDFDDDERTIEPTLDHRSQKYCNLVAAWLLECFRRGAQEADDETQVLVSQILVVHFDQPSVIWKICMLSPHVTGEQVRALIHESITLLLEKYASIQKHHPALFV